MQQWQPFELNLLNYYSSLNQKALAPVQIAQKIFDYETASNPSSISAKERERGRKKTLALLPLLLWQLFFFFGGGAITTAIFGFAGLGMGRNVDKVIVAIAEQSRRNRAQFVSEHE